MVDNDPHPSNIGMSRARRRAGWGEEIFIRTDMPFIAAIAVGPPMLPRMVLFAFKRWDIENIFCFNRIGY
jgi:hypothetical protein